jgi:hypothetical protein
MVNGSLEQNNGDEETENGLGAKSSSCELKWNQPFFRDKIRVAVTKDENSTGNVNSESEKQSNFSAGILTRDARRRREPKTYPRAQVDSKGWNDRKKLLTYFLFVS